MIKFFQDLFSIAIRGPIQTPYENSLCLFDSALPAKYPTVPPKVNFLPYGAGRLNPNLYDCGKVKLKNKKIKWFPKWLLQKLIFTVCRYV